MVSLLASTATKPNDAFFASTPTSTNNPGTDKHLQGAGLKDINGGSDTQAVIGGTAALPRSEFWLLPTKITDRFGKSVQYNYEPGIPGKLLSIVADDGRQVNFTYGVVDKPLRITSVTDGTRTWTYQYDSNGTDLEKVILPDASFWQFNLSSLLHFLTTGGGAAVME